MKRKSLFGLFLVVILTASLAVHTFAVLPGIADDGIIDGTADARNRDDGSPGGNDVNGDGRIESSQESDGLLTTFDRPDSEPSRDTATRDTSLTDSTANRPTDTDTAMAGSSSEDGGFSWWGLVIALLIAAAVIALIVVLIPKRDQSDARR